VSEADSPVTFLIEFDKLQRYWWIILQRRVRLYFLTTTLLVLQGCNDFICQALGECPDLLHMTMTETAEDFFNVAFIELTGKTDTEFALGALALTVHQDGYFRFGNIDLFRLSSFGDVKYHTPKINFLVYSDPIMSAIANDALPILRDSSRRGGNTGHLGDIIIFGHDTDVELRENGASSQFIGVTISYIDASLFVEMKSEITNAYGNGVLAPNLDSVQYWEPKGRYIVASENFNTILIYSEQQAWQNCLYLGLVGVLDLGGCDVDSFREAAPYSYRTNPHR